MVTLAQLKRDLKVIPEDMAAVSEETKKLMTRTSNAGFSVSSQYAFKCVCCESMGLPSVYKLIKKQVGPLCYSRETDPKMLKSAKGIVRLDELEREPEFSSTLNFTEEGYVCDHCYDTIYSED